MMSETGRPLKSVPRSPCDQPGDVLAVLDGQRVVEVVLVAQLGLHGGRAAGRSPPSARMGSPGQGEHHREDQERRTDQDRDRQQQATRDVAGHAPPRVSSGPRVRERTDDVS
jgi:hypothetical protein